ncbi:MAG TPA: phosphoribosylanthranilate isomerase [bacterium]|nr:phosphoribosylanthranilate isomerase [bacterium]HQL63910.1 phosphoribosylanthranilate isomerase [bacterium]
MRTRIKICGITSPEDARFCVDAGADALGLNFCPSSPRFITMDRAMEIVACVPSFVSLVGVFVEQSGDEIRRIMERAGLHLAQVYGAEISEIPIVPILRVRRIRSAEDVRALEPMADPVVLVDTYRKDLHGGTGETFDWALVRKVAQKRRIILAGGLTPENVGEAICLVRPYAVDVASGVEYSPGRKDHERVSRFVEAVRTADHEMEGSGV